VTGEIEWSEFGETTKGTMKTKRNRRSKVARKDCSRRYSKRNAVRSRKPSETAAATVNRLQAAVVEPTPAPVENQPYTGDSAFHLYVREIGQTKLLTPKEEVQLARRIQKGDAAAREHMIKANLRLVVKIARDYENYGLPLLDLINEGNMGLMRAVEKFDPRKGAKLSTYAAWWIKQSIRRALSDQSKTIRIPVHATDKLLHIRRTATKLEEELGREPTPEEIGDELDIPAKQVRQLQTAAIRPASLDAPLGDDESNRVADVIADERATNPYEELEEKTNADMVREVINILDPREMTILRYRFGLDGGGEKTLEEVGEKFGVTRERIRQIQNVALRKLRRKIEKLDAVSVAA
jgi:RNA polymerase primary sigma factor